MKKEQIHVGKSYLAKVGSRSIEVRIELELPRGGWDTISVANKSIRVKKADQLRELPEGPAHPKRKAAEKPQAEPAKPAQEAAAPEAVAAPPASVLTESTSPDVKIPEPDLIPITDLQRQQKAEIRKLGLPSLNVATAGRWAGAACGLSAGAQSEKSRRRC